MAKARKSANRASQYELVSLRNPANRLNIRLSGRKPETVLAGALEYLGFRVSKPVPAR